MVMRQAAEMRSPLQFLLPAHRVRILEKTLYHHDHAGVVARAD
eukprot:COSAG02_NODE_65295_length_258_cov_0.886792_1_plen_42_part_10